MSPWKQKKAPDELPTIEQEPEEEVKEVKRPTFKKVETSKEPSERVVVVKELPVKQIREYFDKENNTNVHFMTIEEALTDLMND